MAIPPVKRRALTEIVCLETEALRTMTESSCSSSPQQQPSTPDPAELSIARAQLRRGVRRPSDPDLIGFAPKSRIASVELSISHQGWLTKLSRGGLPNWVRCRSISGHPLWHTFFFSPLVLPRLLGCEGLLGFFSPPASQGKKTQVDLPLDFGTSPVAHLFFLAACPPASTWFFFASRVAFATSEGLSDGPSQKD